MILQEDRTPERLADDIVSMSRVLRLIGMEEVEYASSGAKVMCPFASVYHPDGQKSFRVYDDKSAYCYACGERFTPVSMYARARGMGSLEAAEDLLEVVGYVAPTAESRFEAALKEEDIDRDSLAEALKTHCARNYPGWEIDQFDDDVAAMLRKCLTLLPNVRSQEEVRMWMTAAKTAMNRVLGGPNETR